MKGTEHFKEIIKSYLDQRAKEDELFRAKYETTARTIDDVVTFILHEVKNSGCCGFSDSEIYSMAVHAIDEPDLEIGKPLQCSVVVNHHIELTEEGKSDRGHSRSNAIRTRSCARYRHAMRGRKPTSRNRRANRHYHSLTTFEHETEEQI